MAAKPATAVARSRPRHLGIAACHPLAPARQAFVSGSLQRIDHRRRTRPSPSTSRRPAGTSGSRARAIRHQGSAGAPSIAAMQAAQRACGTERSVWNTPSPRSRLASTISRCGESHAPARAAGRASRSGRAAAHAQSSGRATALRRAMSRDPAEER